MLQMIASTLKQIDGWLNPATPMAQYVYEDEDATGYWLVRSGHSRNPLLDVAPAEFWREIERKALAR